MAINFPASPNLNDTFISGGVTYTWDGTVWVSSGPAAFLQKSGDVMTGDLGVTTINSLAYPDEGSLGNRNMIVNGAMQQAQRAISVNSITSTAAYLTVDRFKQFISGIGSWTVERHASGPMGFEYSYRLTCLTGNPSPAASANVFVRYGIEKQDMERLAWGTADAKECTLSFWVKSNRTGTASLSLAYVNNSTLTGMTKTYTVDAINTWEYKTITFPANTHSQADGASNEAGCWIEWWMSSGSDFTGGAANTAFGPMADNSRNAVNFGLGDTGNQELHLTGVQLEAGSVPTPFEARPIQTELAICQRYYQVIHSLMDSHTTAITNQFSPLSFITTMRDTPTASVNVVSSTGINVSATAISSSGLRVGGAVTSAGVFNWNAVINLDAEL
jgi:hypothetical protein